MTKISKHQSYWKQKGWYMLVLVCVGIQLFVHRYNLILFGIYFTLGAIGVYVIFFRKTSKGDFITWDKTTIKIREGAQEYVYTKDDIDQVSFRNNHLKIKSGAAHGILLDLQGYKPDQIHLLKSFLDLPETAPEVQA